MDASYRSMSVMKVFFLMGLLIRPKSIVSVLFLAFLVHDKVLQTFLCLSLLMPTWKELLVLKVCNWYHMHHKKLSIHAKLWLLSTARYYKAFSYAFSKLHSDIRIASRELGQLRSCQMHLNLIVIWHPRPSLLAHWRLPKYSSKRFFDSCTYFGCRSSSKT